jgi:hypothetical protein
VGSKSYLIHEMEKNLANLKKRILEKNENLTNINKTGLKFSTTRVRYNLDYINKLLKPKDTYYSSSDTDSSGVSVSSSDSDDDTPPQALNSYKSTHSLSFCSARNPKTSDFMEKLDEESVRNIMENFGMGK